MKKFFASLFFILTFVHLSGSLSLSQDLSLTSYYPSPSGSYDQIRIYPQPAIAPFPKCFVGTLYTNLNNSGRLYYCNPDNPNNLSAGGTYGPFSGIWTLMNKNIYITNPVVFPLRNKVAIGVQVPVFKLTIENDGGILATGTLGSGATLPDQKVGSRLIWYPRKAAFRAGAVDGTGTQWDDPNIGDNSVALGNSNLASTPYATVTGGKDNKAIGLNSIILGGVNNEGVSGGGIDNIGSEYVSGSQNNGTTIYGGSQNRSDNTTQSIIAGGARNRIFGNNSAIGGGSDNRTPALTGTASNTILGGRDNIGSNQSDSPHTVVGGGQNNRLDLASPNSPIAGGGGGLNNRGGAGGGEGNLGPVAGGNANINGFSGFINNPTFVGFFGTVGGGQNNSSRGEASAVGGGHNNSVEGKFSIIPGGEGNIVLGDHSLAAGGNMRLSALADRTFLWGHAAGPINPIDTSDAFIIYSGRVGINDTAPNAILEINGRGLANDYLAITADLNTLPPGDIFFVARNGWVGVGTNNPQHPLHFLNGAYVDVGVGFRDGSSRDYKENIVSLDLAQARQALKGFEPVTFYYRNNPNDLKVGFIAEDVPQLVATQDRQGVSSLEIVSVLTEVIQNQEKKLKEQEILQQSLFEEIKGLRTKVEHHAQP